MLLWHVLLWHVQCKLLLFTVTHTGAKQGGSQAVKMKRVSPGGSHPDADRIDIDGLPHVGAVLYPAQAWYNTEDVDTGTPAMAASVLDLHGTDQAASCFKL